jgi:hypothetical protein
MKKHFRTLSVMFFAAALTQLFLTGCSTTRNASADTSRKTVTNFSYSPDKYYTIVNKSSGAKLGISYDYNIHASAYREYVPSGEGPNDIVITDRNVFRFRFMPTGGDASSSEAVSKDCFIVNENLFALQDASEIGHGQWLIFRYLDKSKLSQQWSLVEKEGSVTIINKATGRCVDLAGGETHEGAAVFSYDINDDPQSNANQKWLIEEAGR